MVLRAAPGGRFALSTEGLPPTHETASSLRSVLPRVVGSLSQDGYSLSEGTPFWSELQRHSFIDLARKERNGNQHQTLSLSLSLARALYHGGWTAATYRTGGCMHVPQAQHSCRLNLANYTNTMRTQFQIYLTLLFSWIAKT